MARRRRDRAGALVVVARGRSTDLVAASIRRNRPDTLPNPAVTVGAGISPSVAVEPLCAKAGNHAVTGGRRRCEHRGSPTGKVLGKDLKSEFPRQHADEELRQSAVEARPILVA